MRFYMLGGYEEWELENHPPESSYEKTSSSSEETYSPEINPVPLNRTPITTTISPPRNTKPDLENLILQSILGGMVGLAFIGAGYAVYSMVMDLLK